MFNFTFLHITQLICEFTIWNSVININQNSSINSGDTKLQFSKYSAQPTL